MRPNAPTAAPGHTPGGGPARRGRRLLLAALPLLALAGVDLALSAASVLPPAPPLLAWFESHARGFTPLVRDEDGSLRVRPDLLGDGLVHTREGEEEGLRYILPGFHPLRIPADKPPGTLRIFVLGGSTVFGLGVPRSRAFPALLRRALAGALPGRRVRLFDLGCPGHASRRVLGMLRVVLPLKPDLVVVYTGHNELLSTRTDPLDDLGALGRARLLALRASSLFRWLDHALRPREDSRRGRRLRRRALAWESGLQASVGSPGRPVEESARATRRAARRFEENLRGMVDAARDAATPILFVLPASNLRFAPRTPRLPAEPAARDTCERALERARGELDRGRTGASLDALARAAAACPGHAMVPFARGMSLLAMGRSDEAVAAWRLARDLDTWTHRITTPLERAFARAMEQSDGAWVDLRPWSASVATGPRLLFLDHCHPTEGGHEAIARALVGPALSLLDGARSAASGRDDPAR